ncbi:MAG: DUF362 domain-containing protein [Synergistaceae bacterium]|jgi:uncharacterized protein (DUF362 family)/NAD-dependent dihydropyrimidine dehydrogenase PreA subunit|nr:DUF362 domain-containing protein [Synergistaceae bacterium]
MICEVGIARCASYDPGEVAESLALAIERAGGMPPIESPDVLIKANLLSPSAPDRAVTTHPEVLRAIVGEVRKIGNHPVHIADNPGYIFTSAEALMDRTGVGRLAEIEGVTVGLLAEGGLRSVSSGSFRVLSEARVSKRYLDAGYCINAAKLKTHVETETSGCIKNIFGTADTSTRKICHSSASQRRLAEAIVDLFSIRPPQFHILDAVVGMEGDGPSHGTPRRIGFLLAGRSALAVDWVAATIMGYENPLCIPVLDAASARGLGPSRRSEITLRGAEWGELPAVGFKKSSGLVRMFPTFLRGLAHSLVSITPRLEREKCVRCGICGKVCPVNAISDGPSGADRKRYPKVNRRSCVRCLCCHEMCPTGAMAAHKNLPARLAASLRDGFSPSPGGCRPAPTPTLRFRTVGSTTWDQSPGPPFIGCRELAPCRSLRQSLKVLLYFFCISAVALALRQNMPVSSACGKINFACSVGIEGRHGGGIRDDVQGDTETFGARLQR